MELLIFIVVLTSILTALAFVLYQTDIGKYRIRYQEQSSNEEENCNKI